MPQPMRSGTSIPTDSGPFRHGMWRSREGADCVMGVRTFCGPCPGAVRNHRRRPVAATLPPGLSPAPSSTPSSGPTHGPGGVTHASAHAERVRAPRHRHVTPYFSRCACEAIVLDLSGKDIRDGLRPRARARRSEKIKHTFAHHLSAVPLAVFDELLYDAVDIPHLSS